MLSGSSRSTSQADLALGAPSLRPRARGFSHWPDAHAGGGGQREERQADFLEDRFDLTPAEARLVAHLVAGASLRSCAKALGIKYETVRSYLKSAFRKTGTHRQAELVLTAFGAMSDSNFPAVPDSPPTMLTL
jgi:DNA-binding CsgD family transcriptional regulator